jgi:hypothetical protein
MKNLILVLFAIVSFSFGINAQDLSFTSFDKNLKPKGELVVVEKWNDREDYYFQEFGEHSITEFWFYYDPIAKKVGEARTKQAFYDELDFDNVSITPDSSGKYVYVEIKTKNEKKAVLNITYQSDEYDKYTFADIKVVAKSQKDADALVAKLKDKAFDMSLDLDAKIERVSPINHSLKFSEEFPDGADRDQVEAAKNGGGSSAKSESKDADEEETTATKTNTNSSNNSASNNSTPKGNGKVSLKIHNKTNSSIDIEYESGTKVGGTKTQTSVSQRTTRSVSMPVGGRVFIKGTKTVLLVVTADMEDTTQVIAQ